MSATSFTTGQAVAIGDQFIVNGQIFEALKSIKTATAYPKASTSYKLIGPAPAQVVTPTAAVTRDLIATSFLKNDGNAWSNAGTDNYQSFQERLDNMVGGRPVSLIIPDGDYKLSQGLKLRGQNILMDFRPGARLMIPSGESGITLYNVRHDQNCHIRNPTLISNRGNDGYVPNNDAQEIAHRKRLGVPDKAHNMFMQWNNVQQPGEDVGFMKSFDPRRYKAHGIVSYAVALIEYPDITGFGGAGVFFHAEAIGTPTKENPLGTNASMSKVICSGSREVRQCGFSYAVIGSDANQITFDSPSGRNAYIVNFYEDSLEGTMINQPHASTGAYGEYWLISPNAHSAVDKGYAEGSPMRNIAWGYAQITGGAWIRCTGTSVNSPRSRRAVT
jgi:hypothetical protein